MSYKISDYGKMIAETARVAAYRAAIREKVRPGSSVLDLGAGTGLFSFIALEEGAGRVVAVDNNPALDLARKISQENSLEDKIEFYQEDFFNLKFDQEFDLVVSDLRGKLPFFGRGLEIIRESRNYLSDDGVMIPFKDKIYLALSKSEKHYNAFVKPQSQYDFKFTQDALSTELSNLFYSTEIQSKDLLSEAKLWNEINYYEFEDFDYSKTLRLEALEDGSSYGFYLWFEAYLTEEIKFSCGPGQGEKIYGSVFFPFTEGLKLKKGEEVVIDLSAKLVGANYIWSWNSKAQEKSFKQSTCLALDLGLT